MRAAYVDTSCLVAIALNEPGGRSVAVKLQRQARLLSASLLEAEFRAAMKRERIADGVDDYLGWISWIMPNRPLTAEIEVVLDNGYVRGAGLWHLACAVYLAEEPGEMSFFTLDDRQAEVAAAVGFRV